MFLHAELQQWDVRWHSVRMMVSFASDCWTDGHVNEDRAILRLLEVQTDNTNKRIRCARIDMYQLLCEAAVAYLQFPIRVCFPCNDHARPATPTAVTDNLVQFRGDRNHTFIVQFSKWYRQLRGTGTRAPIVFQQCNFLVIPRLHNTTSCQTGLTTGLTTGYIV